MAMLSKEMLQQAMKRVHDNPSQGLKRYTKQDKDGNLWAITPHITNGKYCESKVLLKGVIVFD